MSAPPSGASATRRLASLVYATRPGYRALRLDLHLPARAPAGLPVVLHIHGGAWCRGVRELTSPPVDPLEPFARFAAAGFAVATIDYRLSGEARFPAQLDDVRAAVAWLRDEGSRTHGLDRDRIVAWGESAGAHLAALLGLTAGPGQPDAAAIRGVIDWYGPTDLLALAATPPLPDEVTGPTHPGHPAVIPGLEHDSPDSPEGMLLGGTVTERPDAARAASPTTYAHGAAPPFLIRHGADDMIVPADQSERLAAALGEAGAPVDFALVPGTHHSWIGAPDPGGLLDEAIAFARRCVTAG